MALSLFPERALADFYPSEMYLWYCVDGTDKDSSGWSKRQLMTKSADGKSFSFNLPEASSHVLVIFASENIAQATNADESPNWSFLQGNDSWCQYCAGNGTNTLTNGNTLYAYGTASDNYQKITGSGAQTITLTKTNSLDGKKHETLTFSQVATGTPADKPLSEWDKLPEYLYVSYRVDGGNWVFSQQMSKNTSNWTYPLPVCTNKVEFAITRDKVNSETELKNTSDNKKIQYTHGGYADANPQTTPSGTTLRLYGNCGHWLQIPEGGKFDITMTPTDGENEGCRNMIFTYEAGSHGDPDTPSELLFGFRNTGNNWSLDNPVMVGDGQYQFSFNSGEDQALFFIYDKNADRDGNWPKTRYHIDGKNNEDVNLSSYTSPTLSNITTSKALYVTGAKGKSVTVTFRMSDGKITNLHYAIGDPVEHAFSGHLYYGYHGDYGKWTHFEDELLPDADGYYSFTMENKMNQNQYFYITDCGVKTSFRLSNGFPIHRYVDSSDVFDYPVEASDNIPLARHQTRTVCYVPDSKNFRITVKFKYDTETNCVTDLSYTKTLLTTGAITDERTKTNLPLRPRDFFKDEAETEVQPHYFIVGTRMADWRLQPEWEMTKTGENTYEISSPRVMYTGLVSVAKVQRYDNYANNRYYRFSTENGVDFMPGNASAALVNKGPFAFYRDNAPTKAQADRFFSKTGVEYGNDAIQYDKGVVCDKIVLTVDPATGDPVNIEYKYSSDKEVTDYITFSLVGSNIVNQGLPMADYTQYATETTKTSSTWQEAWVQYNPETGVPYRDASGMLIYQTVFQPDWLDRHPSYFNKELTVGDATSDFPYTSASITMRNVHSFTKAELQEDPYAAYYKRFASDGNTEETLGDDKQLVTVSDEAGNVLFRFTETMTFHDNEDSNVTLPRKSKNWQCFVVKDMWMDDFFKIWTGWGGGRKLNEDVSVDKADARWYYANGGHGHAGCHHEGGYCSEANVSGFDVQKKDNQVTIYGTAQDINAADFHINNLTYFKRVIVWYDPEKGFDNSAIQLLIERCGPGIKAMRATAGENRGSKITYNWSIQDPASPLTDQEKNLPVTKYRIDRYKLDAESNEFTPHGVSAEVTCTAGETIGTFMTDQEATDSDLTGGTYRYKVTVEMIDAEGRPVTRDAWSNRVTLFDASIPVDGDAFQVTEKTAADETLYSFDLELDLDINNYLVSALFEGNSITKIAQGYYVSIDPKFMNDLNNAWSSTYDDHKCRYTCHGTSPLEIPQFEVKPLEQIINGVKVITTDRAWIYIPFSENHIAKKLVWENVVKSNRGEDYVFQLFLKRNPDYETVFAAANFGMNEIKAPFVVPGIEVKFDEAGVVVDNGGDEADAADQIFAGKKTPVDAMPMGSRRSDGTCVAPVHYTRANRVDAKFTVTGPAVTQKVTDNFDLTYSAASGKDAAGSGSVPTPDAEAPGVKLHNVTDLTGIAYQKGIDVTAYAKPLEGIKGDGAAYVTLATEEDGKAHIPVYAAADVLYTRKNKFDSEAQDPVMTADKMGWAHGEAVLSLEAPKFSVEARATTNEQDATNDTRYYVHELQANLNFTNLSGQEMVVCPGFHLQPQTAHDVVFDNIFGSTDSKAANGGIVAYDGVKGGNGNYSFLKGYTPFTEGSDYDNASNNWAKLAVKNSTIPVYVDYYWAEEKATGTGKDVPDLDGSVVYHYPFIVKEEATAASTQAARAAGENNFKTITMHATPAGAEVNIEVMTAISDVEADGADAEYFNLQGIPVAQPQAGQVYLVRRGTEVTKELYR